MKPAPIKWTAAIVDRGRGGKAATLFHQYGHEILLVIRGHGTASSAIMDCLGLDEPEKDLVLGIASGTSSHHLIHALKQEMEFHKPGHGIAFTAPLTGISTAALNQLKNSHPQPHPHNSYPSKEESSMPDQTHYELIAAVIQTDLSTPVMEAARKAGCQGGTLIKARELGTAGEKKLFGLTLSQEKAILLILTPHSQKQPILRAICETVLHETGEHALAFSLPIDEAEGIST